jgi:hypothetical protein
MRQGAAKHSNDEHVENEEWSRRFGRRENVMSGQDRFARAGVTP